MKNLVILGAGTAGTMMANHLTKKLPKKEWQITIVDQFKSHYYQPGFLFIPFGTYKPEDVKKTIDEFIPKDVHLVREKINKIDYEADTVILENGINLQYDLLIVATGCKTAPEEVAGMKGETWYQNIFDFYTFEGSCALAKKLETWQGGKLVVHITEMPIKCPVAPLEFAFLADDFFTKKGMRDKVEISYFKNLYNYYLNYRCKVILTFIGLL